MSTQASGRRQRSAISPRRDEDFPGWYQEVVRAAELASMAHVRGCMVIRPWGYGIWDLMKQRLSDEIRVRGHDDAYFPLFIPLSYLEKEAEHVEGFAKEMAVVTHHRLEKRDGRLVPAGELEEPVVVRPTSETVIGASMAEWVQSYRDLPLKLNQWANVVRWEMRPRVFLRTTEFLWQEGHTAHATEAEAMAETLEMHEMYRTFAEQWLAVPVLTGEKSPSERFPGAVRTYTIEAMMQDGKALQAGTSHYLGQNFARAAGISFTDAAGERVLAHTTSWGMSTRMVGAVVMAHGDDDGLCLPPTLAPHQVVVVPMLRGDPADTAVSAYAERIAAALGTALRVHVDRRAHRPAEKKWQWVKKGAPLLVEVGARDETAGTVTWRNRLAPHEAVTRSFAEFVATADAELRGIQAQLLARARERLAAGLRRDITTRAEAEEFFTSGTGFVLAGWCGSPVCEVAFKPLGVTIRCLPTEERATSDSCLACGRPSVSPAVFAASY